MFHYPKIRLFVEAPLHKGSAVMLEDRQAHYLRDVMRLKQGDAVTLFNGQDGEWRASLSGIGKKNISLHVEDIIRPQQATPDLWLCFAPLKQGRVDYMVEKATELGVSLLQPVMTKHTVVTRVNEDRLRAHAVEAAEQSERLTVPVWREPVTLPKLLGSWPKDRALLYGDETGGGVVLRELLPTLSKGAMLAVLTGPEGGFAPDELSLLRGFAHAKGVGLGPRVLRADTAALAALACVQAWAGDWHEQPAFRSGTR